MAHNIKWDDLQFVLAVAEQGSLSAAARQLGVNHATVLRRISAFEESFGVSLFDRKSNGYALTSESRSILTNLHTIEHAINGLERSLIGLGTPYEGKIRVTSTDSICQDILPPHLFELNLLHPGLEIELVATNSRLDLSRLDADVTIRPTAALEADLVGERVCNLTFRIYGSPSYLRNNPSSDMDAHQWLGVSEVLARSPVGQWQHDFLEDKLALRADSFITLRSAAIAGMGLVMMPDFVVSAPHNLVVAPQFDARLETGLWVATHRDLATSPRIKALFDYFQSALRNDAARFEGR